MLSRICGKAVGGENLARFDYPLIQKPRPPYREENKRLSILYGGLLGRLGLSYITYGAASAIASALLLQLTNTFNLMPYREAAEQLVTIATYSLPFLFVILLYMLCNRMTVFDLLPSKKISGGTFFASVGVVFGFLLLGNYISSIVGLILELFGVSSLPADVFVPRSVGAQILFFISYAILPPLFEEVCFRSIAVHAMRKAGVVSCIVLSSLLFAFSHGSIAQLPGAFLLGACSAYFMLKYDNIWIGITAHFLNNGIYAIFQLCSIQTGWEILNSINIYLTIITVVWMLTGIVYLAVKQNAFSIPLPADNPFSSSSTFRIIFNPLSILLYIVLMFSLLSGITLL